MNLYYTLTALLAITYIGYYVTIKILLSGGFTLQEILLQAYILTCIFVVILFRNEFSSIGKKVGTIDSKYFIFIIVLAILMISNNGLCIYASNSGINYGKIEAFAHSIYLPSVTLISAFFFYNAIKPIEYIGIGLVSLGAFFIHNANN